MPHPSASNAQPRPCVTARCSAALFASLMSLCPSGRAEPASPSAPAIPQHMRCGGDGTSQAGTARTVPDRSRIVELAFLKSHAGQRPQLVRYIVMNWFAMDAAAKARGLLDGFSVFESGSDEGAWNVVVSTIYRDARGYEAVKQDFEPIRKGHQEVLIEGRGFDDLGTVVDSREMFEHPGNTSC